MLFTSISLDSLNTLAKSNLLLFFVVVFKDILAGAKLNPPHLRYNYDPECCKLR